MNDMKQVAITTVEQLKEAVRGSKLKLVRVSASWCGPCRSIQPLVEQFEEENDDNMIYLDADLSPELISHFGIRGVPTILKLDDELNVLMTNVGMISKQKLEEFK